MGFKSCGLWNGNNGWRSINGGRRRVDDPVALELVHNLKEINRGADIIRVVCQWDLGRLSDCLVSLFPPVKLSAKVHGLTN
jgi:hypothetical protein